MQPYYWFPWVVVAACTSVGPLSGQAASPTDSARTATIEKFFVITDMEARHLQTVETSINGQLQSTPSLLPYRDILVRFIDKYGAFAVIKPDLIRLYKETFSEREMQELIRFSQSPFGRRVMPKLDAISLAASQLAVQRIQAHQAELAAAIADRARGVPPTG